MNALTTLPLKVFTQRNFVADFLREKPIFIRKTKKIASEAPLGLGTTYAIHLRLIGKLVGDLLLVIIELFFATCFRFVTIHAFDRQTDRQTDGQTDAHRKTSPA